MNELNLPRNVRVYSVQLFIVYDNESVLLGYVRTLFKKQHTFYFN